MFKILLFYKYVNIDDPRACMYEQRRLCEKFGLKGRIISAKEGINATLEGTEENTDAYLKIFLSDECFKDTHIKRSVGTGDAFPRLSIKVRNDLVSDAFGVELDPTKETGKRLAPEKLNEWLEKKPGTFHIIDMRNDYEYRVGHFDGSILMDIKNFRDLPQALAQIAHLKNEPVVPVCTGGVRCEKASTLLIKEGFKDVYQLNGGIVSYMEKYPGKDFRGSLYVFDNRKVMNFTDPDKHVMIGKCDICQKHSENYANCSLDTCHRHFICCENCQNNQNGYSFCSQNCQERYFTENTVQAGIKSVV